jgi:DNA recombination protein RmuC
MTVVLIVLQILTVVALIVLLLRRGGSTPEAADPQLAQLLAADLPGQIARLHALMDVRSEALNQHLRGDLSGLRNDSAAASGQLRTELLQTIDTLSRTLRGELLQKLDATRQENEAAAERLRSRVQEGLQQLSASNEKKLEEMRVTVDEKLHATLQTRLTESFGQVTDQLTKVHAGMGEMSKLSAGVDDLSRIFTNVKSRGGFAEIQLGKLLDQVLAPGQYVQNANVRPNTQEVVEYAVRFPGTGGDVLLPIDAKFPREDWERLESAYESNDLARIETARKSFDAAIRIEGKRICSKYINEPVTTPYAIMFLPTEGLYAEVLRREGLQADLHQNCRVMVAGPTNLYALLTSFQLGFKILNLQKKGDEVWNVLAAAQTEFGRFGGLVDKMDKQVGTVQNTIRDLGVRTRAINRTLRDVSVDGTTATLPSAGQGAFDGLLPMLAASEEERES